MNNHIGNKKEPFLKGFFAIVGAKNTLYMKYNQMGNGSQNKPYFYLILYTIHR